MSKFTLHLMGKEFTVKILILMLVIMSSFVAVTTKAATTFEVREFRRASELGNTTFRSKSYDRAFEHLDKASKLGNKVSQYALALLYLEGLGVKQDYTKAYLWLNVAAEVKEPSWHKLRDRIHNALSAEQVAALEPSIDEYIKKYGAKTQEVSCYKRSATGTNRKLMQCTKYLTPGY